MKSPGTTTVYLSADGWRWSAKAGNGAIVATCHEAYRNKSHARRMAAKYGPSKFAVAVYEKRGR